LDQLSFKKREQNFGSTFEKGGFPKVGWSQIHFSRSLHYFVKSLSEEKPNFGSTFFKGG